jgi:hypothetical protein
MGSVGAQGLKFGFSGQYHKQVTKESQPPFMLLLPSVLGGMILGGFGVVVGPNFQRKY